MKTTEKNSDLNYQQRALRFARLAVILFCLFTGLHTSVNAQMIIESLTGPVTANEISAYKTYINALSPTTTVGNGNIWTFGNSGKQLEGMCLMYETTGDMDILNKMIAYCDAALSTRDDLASAANGGQLITWTGSVEPVWPTTSAGVTPAGAGIEQGAVLSHMAYCAKLILQNPAIWNTTVSIGDPKGYGATYKARALKYITEGDYVIDHWILPRFIRTSESNHYYFPGAPNTYKPNDPAPWNQAWMLTNAFIRLTECHLLLGDAPSRVAQYDAIVQPNINWFKSYLIPNTSSVGSACWIWRYAIGGSIEDTNHAAYDMEGLWVAYKSGRYGVTFADLIPFANTYIDVVLATVTNGIYAGKVDGTTGTGNSGGDDYVRDEYLYLTEFRPESYTTMANIEISKNKIASSVQITSRLLWEKNRRYLSGTANISLNKTVTASNVYNNSDTYAASKAVDGSTSTRWATDNGITSAWLEVNLGGYYTINKTVTREYADRTTSYKIQYWNGSTWLDAFSGTTIGSSDKTDTFPKVIGSKVRLYILSVSGTSGPSIYEFSVYGTPVTPSNIALNKPVTVSNYYNNNSSYAGDKAVDGSFTTRWATSNGVTSAWLEVNLGGYYYFNQTVTREYAARVASYKVQYWNGTSWLDAYSGTTIGTADKTDNFSYVTSNKVRLNILSITGTSGPTIYEFAVYGFPMLKSSKIGPDQSIAGENVSCTLRVAQNPVREKARISYSLSTAAKTKITLVNLMGQEIEDVINEYKEAGSYEASFDVSKLSEGFYLINLTSGKSVKTIKIAIVK